MQNEPTNVIIKQLSYSPPSSRRPRNSGSQTSGFFIAAKKWHVRNGNSIIESIYFYLSCFALPVILFISLSDVQFAPMIKLSCRLIRREIRKRRGRKSIFERLLFIWFSLWKKMYSPVADKFRVIKFSWTVPDWIEKNTANKTNGFPIPSFYWDNIGTMCPGRWHGLWNFPISISNRSHKIRASKIRKGNLKFRATEMDKPLIVF